MTATEKPTLPPKALTLYGIETELLELLNFRESIESDPDMTPQEQAESLKACDESIAEYIRAEVKKCDGIARYLREFETRAEALKAEAKRCSEMAKAWEKRHDNLEAMVIDIMQVTRQTRIDGRHSVLQLKKNPASLDVAQPALVPNEYRRVAVTMSEALLLRIRQVLFKEDSQSLWYELGECTVGEREPMKDAIKKELKQPCPKCKGLGQHPNTMTKDQHPGTTMQDCDACSGSGKASVPGCRLRTDGVRLEVK